MAKDVAPGGDRRNHEQSQWAVTYVPGTDIADVREYLYVDSVRVRSLLAQVSGGAPTESTTTDSRIGRLQAIVAGIGGQYGHDSGNAERLVLEDLHVSMLESAYESLELLTDVSQVVAKEKHWSRGKVRRQLEPGMVLRVTAPTLLVAPNQITQAMRALGKAVGESRDDEVMEFLDTVDVLYGPSETVAVSIRPTDPPSGRAAFVAQVPASAFNLVPPSLMAGRAGPQPLQLTSLVQVARVPTEREDQSVSLDQRLHAVAQQFAQPGEAEAIDREALDETLSAIGGFLESVGAAAAPKWPAVSVVPLAIYRHVLKAPRVDPADLEEES